MKSKGKRDVKSQKPKEEAVCAVASPMDSLAPIPFPSIEHDFPGINDFHNTSAYSFEISRKETPDWFWYVSRITERLRESLQFQVAPSYESIPNYSIGLVTQFYCPRRDIASHEPFKNLVRNVGEERTFISHYFLFTKSTNSRAEPTFLVQIKSIARYCLAREDKIRVCTSSSFKGRSQRLYQYLKYELKDVCL